MVQKKIWRESGWICSKQTRQGGWTLWSLGLVLALIVFFALLLFKLIPPYLDNQKIHKALNTLVQEQHIDQLSRRAIVNRLGNILYIDYALDLVDIKKDLKITKNNNILKLAINYEVVVPMAYNISALLTFSEQAEIPMKAP